MTDALRADLAHAAQAEPWLRAAYAARGFRPLWLDGAGFSPAAHSLAARIAEAADDGLDPHDYDLPALSATAASPAGLAEADLRLSRAFARYAADLHGARDPDRIFYTDPRLRPPADPGQILDGAARAPSLGTYVGGVLRMNPIYAGLRTALRRSRAAGLQAARFDTGTGGRAGIILANMDRVRGLPADLGGRYVLVNAAAQTLQYYDHGRVAGSMKVVVGKPGEPTPLMAGLIRYAVARPYWNIPPDLVRDSVAPKVLSRGVKYLDAQNFEPLSDWSPDARVLDPAAIDWAAVAAGRQVLRVRQRPGRSNMMGEVKFMFPNDLGVYLHDTPLKTLFLSSQRTMSAGCVRLQDARRLARWLMGPAADELWRPGAPERPVDLPQAVPVYIAYLTAEPSGGGRISLLKDVYGRDGPQHGSVAARAARMG